MTPTRMSAAACWALLRCASHGIFAEQAQFAAGEADLRQNRSQLMRLAPGCQLCQSYPGGCHHSDLLRKEIRPDLPADGLLDREVQPRAG